MANLVAIIFLLSIIFTPLPVRGHVVFNEELETFYKTIISHQTKSPDQPKNIDKLYADIQAAKTGYGKSPDQPKNIDKLYADIQAAKTGYGKSPNQPKNIDKLYTDIQAAKTGYGKSPDQPKNIDVHSINLTVYHRYEDVDHIRKTMPLMFTNQGPSSAVLLKKQQSDIAKQNEALCGSSAAVPGEQRICVNSLQKMMEFVVGCMGSDVKPLFTSAAKWQVYAVTGKATNISNETIGCHKSNIVLPFAVYHCHHINNSIVRAVPLVGEDGIALRVYTVCHLDTTSWDPKHLVFKILNAKPGVPVCHFLTTDDIVWVQK